MRASSRSDLVCRIVGTWAALQLVGLVAPSCRCVREPHARRHPARPASSAVDPPGQGAGKLPGVSVP